MAKGLTARELRLEDEDTLVQKLKEAKERWGGFEHVYWLDGGIAAWQQADLPLVRGRG